MTTVLLLVAGFAIIFKDQIFSFLKGLNLSKPQIDIGDLLSGGDASLLADTIALAKKLPEDSPERKYLVEKVIPALSKELLKD